MAIDGTYAVSTEFKGRKIEGTAELKTDGSKLTGTLCGLGMTAEIQDGKVDGENVSGVVEGPTPLGNKRFKVTGTVVGDRISGTLKSGLLIVSFAGTRMS